MEVCLADVEVLERDGIELLVLAVEEARHVLGVVGGEAEADDGVGVRGDGGAGLVVERGKVLRDEEERDLELADLAVHGADDAAFEILRLVDEHVEWGSGGEVALQRGCFGAREDEGAHEKCRRVADRAAREIDDDDAVARERLLHVERALGLAQDIPDEVVREERFELVQDRRDGFVEEIRRPGAELALEEDERDGVAAAGKDVRAEVGIEVQAQDVDHRRAGRIEKRKRRRAQQALELRAPHVEPDALEGGDDLLGQGRAALRRHVGIDVEADGEVAVGDVEVADVVVARRGNERERFLGERAGGIEQEHAVAAGDVLREDALQARGLAVAGLAVDGDVAQALLKREPVRVSRRTRSRGRCVPYPGMPRRRKAGSQALILWEIPLCRGTTGCANHIPVAAFQSQQPCVSV